MFFHRNIIELQFTVFFSYIAKSQMATDSAFCVARVVLQHIQIRFSGSRFSMEG